MEPFPHHYRVSARSRANEGLELLSGKLPLLSVAPPAEFDGPGDQWSPETLITSASAACFILSFRAVASAAGFDYGALECTVEGELDRIEKVTRFTKMKTHARLEIHSEEDREKAQRLLERAESICLIANSLSAERELTSEIIFGS